MAKFRGLHHLSVDAKGRITLPSKIRQFMAETSEQTQLPEVQVNALPFVLTLSMNGDCLWLMPISLWEPLEEKLLAMPLLNGVGTKLKRLLIGHATEIELDQSGRILLPHPLRELLQVDKQVTLVGQGKTLELWNPLHWQAERQAWIAQEDPDTDLGQEVLASLVL